MVTYYSKAWVAACVEHLNNSEDHLKKAKKLSGKFSFRVWAGPDGKDRLVTWEFDQGKCIHYTFEARPSPWVDLRESPKDPVDITRFSCPFDMMAKLNKGEMGPLKALASPAYQVEGKKTILFKMMQALNSWNAHNAQIECNYNFTKTDDEGTAL